MKILTIIIPVYNVEKYIRECLDSILGFEDDLEIIMINDATPDKSAKIAESYAQEYANMKLLHHDKNKGLGAARNTGIENATGTYVMFLDSDDYLDINKLSSLINTLKHIEHDQVIVAFLRFDEEKGVYPRSNTRFYTKNHNKILTKVNFRSLINLINISPIRIIKLEKIIMDNIKFPNGLYEDVLWSYWFAYSCKSTLVIDNRIYFYRQHPKSILGSTSSRHMELIEQQKKTLSLFKSKSVPEITLSIVENQFIKHSKHVLYKTERIPLELQRDFSKSIVDNFDVLNKQQNNKIKQQNNKIKQLELNLQKLSSIQFLKHPIEKYKQYKQLLKVFYTLKRK